MSRRSSWVLVALLIAVSTAEGAQPTVVATAPPEQSAVEVRPIFGDINNIYNYFGQNHLAIGLDVAIPRTPAMSWVVGGWIATAENFLGAELHLDARYRFLNLNPRVVPFVYGGMGLTAGFPDAAGKTKASIMGFGLRGGGGLDFLVSKRIFPSLQVVFELGPRFLPALGPMATAQMIFGLNFVL